VVRNLIARPGGSMTGRAVGYWVTNVSGETGVELFQDHIIPALVQDITQAGGDVEWLGKDGPLMTAVRHAPETAEAVLLIGTIGSGAASYGDIKTSQALMRSRPLLMQVGYSEEQAGQILSQADDAAKQAKMRELWKQRPNDARRMQEAAEQMRHLGRAQQQGMSELERLGAVPVVRRTPKGGARVRYADGSTLDYDTLDEAESGRWRHVAEQQQKLHEETRTGLAQLETAQTTAGEGPETTARATAEEEHVAGGISTRPEAATETKAEAATETETDTKTTAEEGSTERLTESDEKNAPPQTSREGRVAEGATETDGKTADTETNTETEAQTAEAAYHEADAYAVLSSPDNATRGATRSVLGNNVTEFNARVREVAETLSQGGKDTATKVREVMATHADRLIAQGHRDVVVQGLRQVEQAMAAQGDTRQFLPAQDNASFSDQKVTDAFAEVATQHLMGRDGRRPTTVNNSVQGSSLAPVMHAVTRVMSEGLAKNLQAKGNSLPAPNGRSTASRFTQETLQTQPRSSTAQSFHADGSFGNTPAAPSLSSERSQEERHAERAELDAGIPKDRDWISQMLKLKPQSALHELVRKAATLIDLVVDVNYDLPRFDKLHKFKELFYNDAESPTQTIPGTPDHGYYHQPENGPAEFHVWEGSSHKLITSLHEIGHHLAKMLGAAAENNMANAHKGTRRHQSIVNDMAPERAEYFNSGEEVFARAFAQLIAERLGHLDPEVWREFKQMSKDAKEHYKTWRPDDFAGVRDALMKELEQAQWTLRTPK
jgi:hypothetical protein